MSENTIILARKVDGVIILTDASGAEYQCPDESELWGDLNGILDDESLPKTEVQAPAIRNGAPVARAGAPGLAEGAPVTDSDITGAVGEQAGSFVRNHYGNELAARGVSEVAERLAPLGLRLARRFSGRRFK